jgi:hypothetical protein
MEKKRNIQIMTPKTALAAMLLCMTSAGVPNAAFGAPVLVWGQSNWGEAVWASDNPTDWDGDLVANDSDAFPLDAAASVDTDGDGLADDWNDGVSDTQIVTASVALDDDDDNDGISDSEELASGSDPALASDVPVRSLSPAIINAIRKDRQ